MTGEEEGLADVSVARKGRLRRARKLVRLLRHSRYRRALRAGVAATIEHEVVAFAHDFRSIVDIGAHQGQFALLAWRRFPHADLYCVEPLPEAIARLERVLRDHPSLRVLPFAAGSDGGRQPYHLSLLSDSSSLLPITSRYTTAFPGTDEARVIEVEAARLDDALAGTSLARPSLLKLDVQGSELDVLRGAERVLEEIDEIFVECSFVEFYRGQALIDDVIDHLRARGFRLSGIYSVVRDGEGRCLQADLLFRRASESG